MNKPRTSNEFNIYHIENALKKVKKGLIPANNPDLIARFKRLNLENEGMYVDLYSKYVDTVRNIKV